MPKTTTAFFTSNVGNEEAPNNPTILFGTRNGYIIEATVEQGETIKLKQAPEKKIHVSLNKAKIVAYANSFNEVEQTGEDDEESSEDEGPIAQRFDSKRPSKMSMNFVFYLTSHSGTPPSLSRNYQQRVLYAVHPKLNVMFTVGEDQYLSIWDIDKCTLLKQVKQDNVTPTALKITPDGEILAIGFNNGMVVLQDVKMTANPLGKYSESTFFVLLNYKI